MKTTRDMMKAANASAQREQASNGVILRASTFIDRKKEASRQACRGSWKD